MPVDQSSDFERYKQLIYKHFGITSEQLGKSLGGDKTQRRNICSAESQTFKLPHKVVKEIMALEQFYIAINGELKYLVKEMHPKTLQEAADLANQINVIRSDQINDHPKFGGKGHEAQKNKSHFEKERHSPGTNRKDIPLENNSRSEKPQPHTSSTERKWNSPNFSGSKDLKCWNCGGGNHLSFQCKKRKIKNASSNLQKKTYCIHKVEDEDRQVAMTTRS
ncbi:hypothetical protein JRQ81_000590, partial [Phrynocephalus forsythii]